MATVSFRVLGPLEVTTAGRAVPLGGRKPRLLLAALLLRANDPVPADHLVDVLWPDGAPRSAAANLRTYVHALRRELPDRIRSCPTGYLVATASGELDAEVFEERATAARRAAREGNPGTALALLDEADALWRGEVLDGLPHSPAWGSVLARLAELRLSVQAERAHALVALGDIPTAVAELRGLVAAHPLREELWQQLVRALEIDGRTTEALDACGQAERILAAELGTAPGPPLRELRSRLLAGREEPASPAAAAPVFPVCQLPLDLPDFTGRDRLVAELVGLLRRDRSAPALVALSGPPGVGKSATAVRVAHAVRERFPDGQLHVDLRGTSAEPRPSGDVLAELLRALGEPDGALPRTPAERAALLRSRLAPRRICLVLDDAANAAQVRPLLPGTGGCAVLVTARVRMPDLAGAHAVDVGLLSESEALRLLSEVAGAERTAAEPDSAAAIVRSCGHLPLAIRIAGARLAHRPSWPLPMMADRLRDESRRLGELRAGDLAVDASVTLSYDQLPAEAALAFRGLGLLGQLRFPGWVVSALIDAQDGGAVLDALVDAHLVEPVGADVAGQPRYRLHDLLRCYAVERASLDDPGEHHDALRRVVEGYLSLAAEMGARLPVRFFGVVPDEVDGCRRPADAGEERLDPADWFTAERTTVTALVALAARHRIDDLAWRLTGVYTPFFDLRSHQEDWLHTHAVALESARREGDERGQAILLRNLGQVHIYQDDYAASLAAFEQAQRLFHRIGDERGTAIALSGVATALRFQGHHERSIDRACHALALFTGAGDRAGEAAARIAVGTARLHQGCHGTAGRWFTDAYELCAAIGDRHREAHALKWLAMLHQRRGNLGAARENVDRAIAIFAELGDDHCVGYAHQSLGELYLRSGDLPHAKLLLVNSLSVHRRSGDRRSEAEVSERLSELHAALGQPGRSRSYRERARTIWGELAGRPRPGTARRVDPPAGSPALPA
ncbi:AfsR/SARP family transcriptional regulator [Amycolatopsis antarctica]|uniref:AfsR/SARP family transcriptional regulator n=1 Tax=Amycolatopsis antarctica TaxID=1854586 RepID=UPI001F0A6861|nr:BTAD domain-containing putative transcriptional regulator [Amycolatopsis antarctica]